MSPKIEDLPRRPVMQLYLLAAWLHRHGALARGLSRVVCITNRLLTAADIDPRSRLHPTVHIPHPAGVVIGERAVVGARTVLMSGVVLGSASWTTSDRHPVIGNDVLIGTGAKILGRITIGDRARIGANAVVLSDVPADSTAVGVPASVVRSPQP